MGKYSNVETTNLINAKNKALADLKKSRLPEIAATLQDNNVFQSDSKPNIVGALNQIINSTSIQGSIAQIKKTLNSLDAGIAMINKYKTLEKEIENLETNKYREVTHNTRDAFGNIIGEYTTNEIDDRVANRIDRKYLELQNLETRIDNYFNRLT